MIALLLLAAAAAAEPPLSAPSGLAFDPSSKLLFIADTGHDRVIVASEDGRVKDVIGAGMPGFYDDDFSAGLMAAPRGLAPFNGTLLIADSESHALRRADLKRRKLATAWFWREPIAPASLALAGEMAYLSSPARGVLWAIHAVGGEPRPFAGSGVAGSEDGPPPAARFDRPEALAAGDGKLFIGENGALRELELPSGFARTLTREGLARPAALAFDDGKLYVADAGDGKIKVFDLKAKALTVLAEGFREPRGLARFRGGWLVAEAGADRLVRLSADGKKRAVFKLKDLPPPPKGPRPPPAAPAALVKADLGKIAAGPDDRLLLDVRLPRGWGLNARGAFRWRVPETRGAIVFTPATRRGVKSAPTLPIVMPLSIEEGPAQALVSVDFFYCREDGTGECRAKAAVYEVSLSAVKGEKSREARLLIEAD